MEVVSGHQLLLDGLNFPQNVNLSLFQNLSFLVLRVVGVGAEKVDSSPATHSP